MALRRAQIEMAISLFAKVFSTTKDEKAKKELPAYKIYKHLGFQEIENYVHMKQY